MSISLLAAFLGGVISLLSPCSVVILPAFFAASLQKSHHLVRNTLIFTAGVLTVLFPLGLGAWELGQFLTFYRTPLSLAIAAFLLVSAVLTVFGKHIPLPDLSGKIPLLRSTGTNASILSLGMISAVGSSSCTGPILGAILTLAFTSPTPYKAATLMVAYTLGLVIPLITFALALNRYGKPSFSLVRGKVIEFGRLKVHPANLLSAILFLLVAYIFLRYQGSLGLAPFFQKTGILDLYFDLQDRLFTL